MRGSKHRSPFGESWVLIPGYDGSALTDAVADRRLLRGCPAAAGALAASETVIVTGEVGPSSAFWATSSSAAKRPARDPARATAWRCR